MWSPSRCCWTLASLSSGAEKKWPQQRGVMGAGMLRSGSELLQAEAWGAG